MFKKKICCLLLVLLFFFTNNVTKNILASEKNYNEKATINKLILQTSKVKLFLQNKQINFSTPLLVELNRYYLPLREFLNITKAKYTFQDGIFHITRKKSLINIDVNNKIYTKNKKSFELRKAFLVYNTITYISLFDLTKIFDFITKWEEKEESIYLYKNRAIVEPKPSFDIGSPALIRLEDITAGQRYSTHEALMKLRIVSDFLYSSGVPFHVAWVPRYINPSRNIDNCPAYINSFYNSDFVFTLDYMLSRNALIGLHGYTHQFNKTESVLGKEFSKELNLSEDETRKRILASINCASKLDIPISFFETPHYSATTLQHQIMANYFSFIYEPLSSCNKDRISTYIDKDEKKTIYIPTPLGYVKNIKDAKRILESVSTLNRSEIASFYFHPTIDFKYIKICKGRTSYPHYTYLNNSVLHKIVKTFTNKGYRFVDINYLK